MAILYNISIYLYRFFIFIASLFNKKAKLWVTGRKGVFDKLKNEIQGEQNIVWFHAASLGEFEQGRPVIEAFRKTFPGFKILLTFFSPSGYEVRKNYNGVDYVFYLPLDTRRNARLFVKIVNPKIVFFIKYEFWFNYLNALFRNKTSVVLFSGIFRDNQHFFKWYGGWFRKALKKFTYFFVQNQNSYNLLKEIGINKVEVSGDTRFDRVYEIAQQSKKDPIVELFCRDSKIILAGSTWPQDEQMLESLSEENSRNLKMIMAPHEVHLSRVQAISKQFEKHKPLRYSQADEKSILSARVLIIDKIGILSGLYRYCHIAFIGGGFGSGIHNILEAVTFGKPVVFGPNYQKFREAVDLIKLGGAFSLSQKNDISKNVDLLLNDKELYENSSSVCKEYINDNVGATKKILKITSKYIEH